jgi:hypothetical protein
MDERVLFQALERIIDHKTLEKVRGEAILKDKNSYTLFSQYLIKKLKYGYEVSKLTGDKVYPFTSLKYAVAWVSMDQRNLIVEANRLEFLDGILSGIDLSIKLYEKYEKSSKSSENRLIYITKLNESLLKKKRIMGELNDMSERARKWQMDKFSKSSSK